MFATIRSIRCPADISCITDFRQCILFDGTGTNARIIGIEYMITPKLYDTLEEDERKLWHSHVFEVKSGMLIMPAPRGVPNVVWQAAETKEMEKVVKLYGKVYHLWQVDRGDKLPLGPPRLMTSYTAGDQLDFGHLLKERDERFGANSQEKAEARKHIKEPQIHPGKVTITNSLDFVVRLTSCRC